MIPERSGNRTLAQSEFMHDLIDFFGRDSRLNVLFNVNQRLRGQLSSRSHFWNFVFRKWFHITVVAEILAASKPTGR